MGRQAFTLPDGDESNGAAVDVQIEPSACPTQSASTSQGATHR